MTVGITPAYTSATEPPITTDPCDHQCIISCDDDHCYDDNAQYECCLTIHIPDGDIDIDDVDPDSISVDEFEVERVFDPVEQFVNRLYANVLGRGFDASGLQFWSTRLKNGTDTGANVARGFFFSNEFINQRNSNNDFVEKLYLTLMGRQSDQSGKEFWLNHLNNGWPRENIFAGFVNSPEFTNICKNFGINRGDYTAPPGGMARVFTTRLYRTTLQREPDESGLNFWHEALITGRRTGAVIAYDFIFSIEMFNRNLSDDHFIEIMYNAMMGRASDPGGKAFWLDRIRNGASRYDVFIRFVNSPEFDRICREYNIIRGTAPPPGNLIPGTNNQAKIWNLIVRAHFRGISDRPEHIAGIIGNLQSEAGTTLCPFQQQVSNQAGIGLMQWSFGRRTALETYMWNNGISQEQFQIEMNKHLTSICTGPGNHPQAFLDRILEMQINFMFHELRNTSERLYMNYIDFPIDKTGVDGARAYAELFCSLALRPGLGVGEINNIQDEGVIQALEASPYVGGAGRLDRISYSALEARRTRAENVYRQFLTNHR